MNLQGTQIFACEASEFSHNQRRILAIAVAWGINALAYSIVYPFLPIYLHSIRGIPMSTVGVMYPIMGIAVIIGSPVSGVLTDRVGRRMLLIGGPVGRSCVFFALALMAVFDAPFVYIAAGLFFSTLLGQFFQNSANAYITDLTSPDERAPAFSKVRVGLNVGWMLGPAIGSFLARTPFSLLFSLTATLCLVTASIPYKFCLRATVRKQEAAGLQRESFWTILRHDHRLLLLLALTFTLFLSVAQFVSTLSIYATLIVGISQTSLGFLYTLNGVLVILFLIPLNTWLKRTEIFERIGWGALLYVIAYVGFGVSRCWGHLALSMAVMTIGEMIALTAIVSAVSHMAPSQMVGRYMGLHGLVDGLGWAIGPFFGAILFEHLHSTPLFLWGFLASGALIAGGSFLAWHFLTAAKN
ncbi:major facilitator superfamily MFS_1 [Candidatus Vecturithrix granuli]|uniref:Major facilitator superfamily MFS_1 n=1 Tax=Vecturithrix granuli TaxID=1499967 RepID=A0A081C1J8_VECG1|nr:major facilitator superfamily MFS_1 [Candidatus Vecturithrix granuli]